MMRNVLLMALALVITSATFGQLTGIKNIPGSGGANDYATISAAITALNSAGVGSGGVTFNVAASYTETITAPLSVTATGTLANPIVFQKSGSGANPLITAYTTGTGTPGTAIQDGMWNLVGSDYVTIDGIDLYDPNTVNPATMEYGYAMFKASATDGCQYNTIKNCVVTLSRNNNASGTSPAVDGSRAINVMNSLVTTQTTVAVPTSAAGTNSYNMFYSNTLQNCNIGIALIGYAGATPFTLCDFGNDVGGNSLLTGNYILNYGGAAAATNPAAGVRTLAQYTLNVSYNTVNNNNGSGVNHVSTLRGIYLNTAVSANATITGNTLTINGGSTTSQISVIENVSGGTAAANTITISRNTIQNCTWTTATSGIFYGIYNSAAAYTVNIEGNVVSNITVPNTGSFYGIYAGSPTYFNVYNNEVGNITKTVSGAMYAIYGGTAILSIHDNNIHNLNMAAGANAMYGIYDLSSPNNETYYNNTLNTFTNSGTGGVFGIYTNTATGTRSVYLNTISGFSAIGGGPVYGIYAANSSPTIYRNNIFNLSSGAAGGIVYGINIVSGTIVNVYNNFVSDLRTPAANAAIPLAGIYVGGGTTVSVYYNSVYLNGASTGALFGSAALYASTTPTLDMRDNILVNLSVPMGTGVTAAYRRSSVIAGLPSYSANSNANAYYAGASEDATHAVYFDGTTPYTMAAFQTLVGPVRDAMSIRLLPFFVNVAATPYDLHISTTVPSGIESGGVPVALVSDDYDGKARQGTAGYTGTGTAPDIGADEFDGIANYTCSTPNPGNTLTTANNLCFGQSITLSLQNNITGTGNSFQWQSSDNGSTYTNITGANASIYTFVPSAPLYFHCVVTCQNGPATATSNPVQITFTNSVTSTTPGSRCGTGSVDLYATGTGNLKWYAALTGGTNIGAGSPFPTPFISATTTYYVAAETPAAGAIVGAGASISTGYESPFYHSYGGKKSQYLILGSELISAGLTAGNLNTLAFNVVTAGTVYNSFNLSIGNTALTALTTTLQTGLTTVYSAPSVTPVVGLNTYTFSSPFAWDGSSNIIVETCWSNNNTGSTSATVKYDVTAFASQAYYRADSQTPVVLCGTTTGTATMTSRAQMYINYVPGCSSARTAVVATVNAPPVLTISASQTACGNTAALLEVTSPASNYDLYTWSPVTNLFTDFNCQQPYVALTYAKTVYAKSATGVVTTYTCSASNSVTNCANTVQSTVTILPTPVIVSAPASICVTGSSIFSPTPATGYGNATFQWQSSADGITYNDILGATSLGYTTPSISTTTYYQLTVKNSAGAICSTPQYTLVVNNPQVYTVTDGSRCGTGTVILGASGSGTLKWYAAASGGDTLRTGPTYKTPIISATTDYWVASSGGAGGLVSVGPVSPTAQGGTITTQTVAWNVNFTTLVSTTIKSVDIFPVALGETGVIKVITGSTTGGTVLATINYTTNVAGGSTPQKIQINYDLPTPGTYNLYTSTLPASGITRNTSGAVYPYTSSVANIISNGYDQTYFMGMYNWTFGSECVSARQMVVANVLPATPITASATPASVCAASPSTLAVTSTDLNYTYNWMPGNLNGASQTVYPETTTTYTVTANDAATGCAITATSIVTVLGSPAPIVITPSAPVITPGTIQPLAATGGEVTGVTIFGENFNAATNNWTTINNSTGGTNAALTAWTLRPDGYVYSSYGTWHSNDNSQFYMSNSDAAGSGVTTATILQSPSFSTVGYSAASLSFFHYLNWNSSSSKVDYSTDGTNWTNLKTYVADAGAVGAFVQDNIAFPAGALGQATVYIRFKYDGGWDYFWGIDNVAVTGTSLTNITWSPVTDLYSDNIAFTPYLGEPLATVYSKPTVTRTYTASSIATATGCIRTKTVTVSFQSSLSLTGSVTDLPCNGGSNGSITTITTGGTTPYTYAWSNGATTANIMGLTAGAYSVTVTDATSTTASGSWTVVQPVALALSATITDASCPTGGDGSINLSVTGGTGADTYLWSNSATTEDLSALAPGVYVVTVTDANGCLKSGSWTVGQTLPVCANTSVTGTVSGTVCYNASTTITVAGGITTFIVSAPNGNATFIAGHNILFEPGTHVAYNAYMHGYISTVYCINPNVPITAAATGQDGPQLNLSHAYFTLYPNPTSGNFTLVQKGEKVYGSVKVEVYSMTGEKVLTEQMIGEKSHEFHFSNIPVGLYFVKVVADEYVETIKLVKTR